MRQGRRAITVLVTALAAALVPAAPGVADFGDLDNTFGIGGTTTLPGVQFLGGVIRVSDNRILTLGETDGTGDFAVEMLRADGTPDPTFGTGGLASTDFAGGEDYAIAAAELPNGDFLVVGGPRTAVAITTSRSRSTHPPATRRSASAATECS